MRMFTLLFFIFFLSFSAHSGEPLVNGLPSVIKEDYNKKSPPAKKGIDSKTSFYGNKVGFLPLEGTGDLRLSWEKIKNAVGLVAIPGFGKDTLVTGFFVTDKLFVTEFLAIDQLRRNSKMPITIWIKDQYFSVGKAKALYGARNIAVLEIESSYKGGVLKLSKDPLTPAVYGVGFDIREIALSDSKYYITAEEVFGGLEGQKNSYIRSTNELLNIMQVIDQQFVSDYQFFQLNRVSLHSSTSGLPFLNRRGEVVGMKSGSFANLVYATPVKFLKEALKGNCGQMSIQKCLDQANETLYQQAKNQDPVAQYAYNNRSYTSYLSRAIDRGGWNEAVRWLLSSSEAGNVLSQLQSVMYLTYEYQCFALPKKNNNGFLYADYLLRSFNQIFSDKKEVVQRSLEWLNQMEEKGITLAYYLKGLMFLNGNCIEKNIEKGFLFLEKAGKRGFFPALNFLIDNYSSIGSKTFNFWKAYTFLQIFHNYGFKHHNPFFNIRKVNEELIVQ